MFLKSISVVEGTKNTSGPLFLYLNKECLIRKTKKNDSAWSSYIFKCVEMSLYFQMYVCVYVRAECVFMVNA